MNLLTPFYIHLPENAQTIVAIRNDQLSVSANPAKQLAADLINALAKLHGIQLHLIEPIDGGLKMSDGSDFKSGGAVVGFGSDKLFGLNAVQKKTGVLQTGTALQRDQLHYTDEKLDLGARLVQSAGGYVFDSTAWTVAKPADQKRWMTVTAAALADHVARTEVQQECWCELTDGVQPRDRCVATAMQRKAPIVVSIFVCGISGWH